MRKTEEYGGHKHWMEIKNKIKSAIKKYKKKILSWKLGKKDQYNKEWRDMKRKLRKELKELNKGWISKEDYVIKRRKYKEWCEEEA